MVGSGKAPTVLIRRLVVAGSAASLAVHKPVDAEAHVELRLTKHTEFFAPAIRFKTLTLGANDAAYTRFSGHKCSLVRPRRGRNITEVTQNMSQA
jgi:hypothetical protein